MKSTQAAPFWHGSGSHSSMFTSHWGPVKPGRQLQWKLLSWSVQVPLYKQGSLSHSLTSVWHCSPGGTETTIYKHATHSRSSLETMHWKFLFDPHYSCNFSYSCKSCAEEQLTWKAGWALTHITRSHGNATGWVKAGLTEAVIDGYYLQGVVHCLQGHTYASSRRFQRETEREVIKWIYRCIKVCDVNRLLSEHLVIWGHSVTLVHGGSATAWGAASSWTSAKKLLSCHICQERGTVNYKVTRKEKKTIH